MKNFNLTEMGLKEMTRSEMIAVEGGNVICSIANGLKKAGEALYAAGLWLEEVCNYFFS